MLSMDSRKRGTINLPYPSSSSLQDTQEFETKRTMSGYKRKAKNRFSENKKWVITWENLTGSQLMELENLSSSEYFPMIDPLGRPCVVKPLDFRPGHMLGGVDINGRHLSTATMELLVVNANHELYAPGGVPITTPANNQSMMPEMTLPLRGSGFYGGNELAFGPVIESDLPRPPLEWNRSARTIHMVHSSALCDLSAPSLAGSTGSIFFKFETQGE